MYDNVFKRWGRHAPIVVDRYEISIFHSDIEIQRMETTEMKEERFRRLILRKTSKYSCLPLFVYWILKDEDEK